MLSLERATSLAAKEVTHTLRHIVNEQLRVNVWSPTSSTNSTWELVRKAYSQALPHLLEWSGAQPCGLRSPEGGEVMLMGTKWENVKVTLKPQS